MTSSHGLPNRPCRRGAASRASPRLPSSAGAHRTCLDDPEPMPWFEPATPNRYTTCTSPPLKRQHPQSGSDPVSNKPSTPLELSTWVQLSDQTESPTRTRPPAQIELLARLEPRTRIQHTARILPASSTAPQCFGSSPLLGYGPMPNSSPLLGPKRRRQLGLGLRTAPPTAATLCFRPRPCQPVHASSPATPNPVLMRRMLSLYPTGCRPPQAAPHCLAGHGECLFAFRFLGSSTPSPPKPARMALVESCSLLSASALYRNKPPPSLRPPWASRLHSSCPRL